MDKKALEVYKYIFRRYNTLRVRSEIKRKTALKGINVYSHIQAVKRMISLNDGDDVDDTVDVGFG